MNICTNEYICTEILEYYNNLNICNIPKKQTRQQLSCWQLIIVKLGFQVPSKLSILGKVNCSKSGFQPKLNEGCLSQVSFTHPGLPPHCRQGQHYTSSWKGIKVLFLWCINIKLFLVLFLNQRQSNFFLGHGIVGYS